MDRRSARVLVWISLAVPLVMVAVYLSLVRSQASPAPDVFTVPFVAGYMLLMVVMLAVSQARRANAAVRAALRGGAAAGLLVLGVLAAFSIGLPILVAGVIAAVAFALSIDRSRWLSLLTAGLVTAIVCGFVLLLGVDVANRTIVCPPDSSGGGGGNGILLGPYQYQCVGGQVVWSTPSPGG